MKDKALPLAAVAFEEIPLSGPLGDFVDCFWTMTSDGPLIDVWKSGSGLAQFLATKPNRVNQVAGVASFLLRHKDERDRTPDWLVEAIRQIRQADCPVPISHLARQANISSRK